MAQKSKAVNLKIPHGNDKGSLMKQLEQPFSFLRYLVIRECIGLSGSIFSINSKSANKSYGFYLIMLNISGDIGLWKKNVSHYCTVK